MPDTYFELVKRFPLMHIRDDRHMAEAQAVMDELLEAPIEPGLEAYLNALTDLVEIYEDEQEPIIEASEADVLQELLSSNRMSQHQLAKNVGIAQSTISAVLNGERSLTKQQITLLAKHFHISPMAFMS